jgi:hypothetical protein
MTATKDAQEHRRIAYAYVKIGRAPEDAVAKILCISGQRFHFQQGQVAPSHDMKVYAVEPDHHQNAAEHDDATSATKLIAIH